MLLANGKCIGFFKDKVVYDVYTYSIKSFSKAKTLRFILDGIDDNENKKKVLTLMFHYYKPIAKDKASIQHKNREVTKHRDSKCADYGMYKGLLNQIRTLQMEVNFESKIGGNHV